MREYVRVLGFVNLFAGVLLLTFPGTSRRLMQMREQIAGLPDDGLRFLGFWIILLSGTLVWTTGRANAERRMSEAVGAGWREAA